jgi:hypothetical protein
MEDMARRLIELDATKEPFYLNLAMRGASHRMRGAGTIEEPFLLRGLSVVGGEPGPLRVAAELVSPRIARWSCGVRPRRWS